MVQRAQNKALRIINSKEKRHSCEPLFTGAKILNPINIITLNNCMLSFDHLNSSLPTISDHLFKLFIEQNSSNTRGARRTCLKYPKNENLSSFYGSRSVLVKPIKDWNNIIDEIHPTPEDFMKRYQVIKKMKNTLL